jgi:signal transduction histidine kinase/DNA-binding response OmpR family regulator
MQATTGPHDRSRGRILYIEDDAPSRLLVEAVLRVAGFEVVATTDGLSGIEAALREHPALILLDIGLPDVDGYAVATILRTFPKLATTPIVALTAYATHEGDRERTLVAGCDGYLEKPLDVDRFPAQVEEFLHGKRERVAGTGEGAILRELNQRFVCRLLAQLEDAKRLHQLVGRRAMQLETIYRAVHDLTAELGTATLLERLLSGVARALGASELMVELTFPPGTRVSVRGLPPAREGSEATDVEWKMPLVVRDRPLGFITARYEIVAGGTPEDEHLFKLVANQVAIAVENARLYEGEQTAHAEAEAQRARAAFLADATGLLGASLDAATILETLGRLALPDLADVSVVDAVGEDGALRRVSVNSHDPRHQGAAAALRQSRAHTGAEAIVNVLQSGKARIVSAAEPLLAALAADVDRRLLGDLCLGAALTLPLRARGRTLGLVTLLRSREGYTAADVTRADDLVFRAALAVDNARLYQEAQDADRRKDEFLVTLAHELRAPLAPILIATSALSRRRDDDAVDRARAIVERQVRYQAQLLDDLLDLARIGAGKIELRMIDTDLAGVLADALAITRPLIDDHDHHLSLSVPLEPVRVAADPTRLQQVLVNLLVNAVKYTPPGGEITIAVSRTAEHAVIRVRDTGVGIPAHLLVRVFELFVQGDVRGSRGSGLGIGLALVRRLVELHGGRVEAHSDGLGHGAEFVVTLPLPLRVAAPREAPEATAPTKHRHVLIVEDDGDTREALRMALELDGHRVDIAADGGEGVALALGRRPQIVLVNIVLPGIDGYEVARRIRGGLGDGVRLVAITGHGRQDDIRRARDAGFDVHLLKPVDAADLTRVLGDLPAA